MKMKLEHWANSTMGTIPKIQQESLVQINEDYERQIKIITKREKYMKNVMSILT